MLFNKPVILPALFSASLAVLAFLSPARENPRVFWAFLGIAGGLMSWNALLWFFSKERALKVEVNFRKQHYIQACAQGSVLLYWGWHWAPVYESAYLLLAQLLFAYAFDMLLVWSRRDAYILGFGPFPVIFSINLFLWFRPDWFVLQFAMVALGFAAKEFLRWNREGRRVHIFNPSSFPLAVFSLALLVAGASEITWGRDIANTQFYPPHIYLLLFLVALPGQYFFGVTLMTMSAVLSTYVFGLLYFAVTGIYFFYDSYIPIAVFLGMHLLFTDPSTSPRTEVGRVMFGILYGLSTVVLYQLLGSAGLPTFYDKLLQVPLMNLSVKGIDRLARSALLSSFALERLGRSLGAQKRHLAFMSVWAVIFVGMSAVQGVGDKHPGQWLPFWREACFEGLPYACPYLADLEAGYCRLGSGWACNEAGLLHVSLSHSGEDLRRLDIAGAEEYFNRGCDLGVATACGNVTTLRERKGEFAASRPGLNDFPVILRGSKGEIREESPEELYALACRQGWTGACSRNE